MSLVACLQYHVQKGVFQNPETVMVEGDASSATYPLALAAVTGGDVTVTNVGSQSLQGDAQFCTLLQQMGCQVTQTATSTTVKGLSAAPADGSAVPHPSLRAIEVDMDSMTDTFMTLCAVAVFATGTTRIVNIAVSLTCVHARISLYQLLNAVLAGCRDPCVLAESTIERVQSVESNGDGIDQDWCDSPRTGNRY